MSRKEISYGFVRLLKPFIGSNVLFQVSVSYVGIGARLFLIVSSFDISFSMRYLYGRWVRLYRCFVYIQENGKVNRCPTLFVSYELNVYAFCSHFI